jgi:hypothetical protein
MLPRWTVWVAAPLLVAAGISTLTLRANPVPAAPPAAARERAIGQFQAEYGRVDESYGDAESTFGAWRRLEPSNTMALAITPERRDRPVYAVFVTGNFEVYGPQTSEGVPAVVHYSAGRIVFDDNGAILLEQLWDGSRASVPAFGSDFEG